MNYEGAALVVCYLLPQSKHGVYIYYVLSHNEQEGFATFLREEPTTGASFQKTFLLNYSDLWHRN